MELTVFNTSGKETGRTVELDEAIFGIEPNQHAVYLEVKQYLAAQRRARSSGRVGMAAQRIREDHRMPHRKAPRRASGIGTAI